MEDEGVIIVCMTNKSSLIEWGGWFEEKKMGDQNNSHIERFKCYV